MIEIQKPLICIREVNDNLRRIKIGMELTRPLRDLNTHCEFRTKYQEWCNIQDGLPVDTNIKKEEQKAKKKEYQQRPEVKAKKKEYQQRPEVKAKKKEYHQRPEVKAKMKEYKQKPEVKAKKKEYRQKPEVKAKKKEQSRNRARRILNIPRSRWRV